MRRFFATTCTVLALFLATPVHAQPLNVFDVASWLDGLTAWVEDLLSPDKHEDGEALPPPDDAGDSDDTQSPPPDDARGTIDGNG